jgi:Fe-S cluster assembly iron-binding protein IscA
MVKISDDAAGLIRTLVADSDLPASAGLRLGTDDEKHSLAMHLAAQAQQDDEVLEHDGASLFVSPGAAPRLGAQTLHAQLEPRPAFYVD